MLFLGLTLCCKGGIFLYRMNRIKVSIAGIILALFLFYPSLGYSQTLAQVLEESENYPRIEASQSEVDSLQETIVENGKEQKRQLLESMKQNVERLQAEAEARAFRIEQIGKAQPIVDATYSVSSPGGKLCAGWVSMVYNQAGYGWVWGDADDMYWQFCHSSNREDIIPGMIIAVPSHPHTRAGRRWGHVGIIVERDRQLYVRENVGYINEMTLDDWIAYYGVTYTPQWGFAADI